MERKNSKEFNDYIKNRKKKLITDDYIACLFAYLKDDNKVIKKLNTLAGTPPNKNSEYQQTARYKRKIVKFKKTYAEEIEEALTKKKPVDVLEKVAVKNKKALDSLGVDTENIKKEIVVVLEEENLSDYGKKIRELKDVFYDKAMGNIKTITKKELRNSDGSVTGVQVGKEFISDMYEETIKENMPCERALAGYMLLEMTEGSLSNNNTDTLTQDELELTYRARLDERARQKEIAKRRSGKNDNIIDVEKIE